MNKKKKKKKIPGKLGEGDWYRLKKHENQVHFLPNKEQSFPQVQPQYFYQGSYNKCW